MTKKITNCQPLAFVMSIQIYNLHQNFTHMFSLNKKQFQSIKYSRPSDGGENHMVYLKSGTVNVSLYVHIAILFADKYIYFFLFIVMS